MLTLSSSRFDPELTSRHASGDVPHALCRVDINRPDRFDMGTIDLELKPKAWRVLGSERGLGPIAEAPGLTKTFTVQQL